MSPENSSQPRELPVFTKSGTVGNYQPQKPQNPRSQHLSVVPKNRELPRNYGNCRSSQFPHLVWELGTARHPEDLMNT